MGRIRSKACLAALIAAYALGLPRHTESNDNGQVTIDVLLAGMEHNVSSIRDAKILCTYEVRTGSSEKRGQATLWLKGQNLRVDINVETTVAPQAKEERLRKYVSGYTYYYSAGSVRILEPASGILDLKEGFVAPPLPVLSYGVGIGPDPAGRGVKSYAYRLRSQLSKGRLRLVGKEVVEGNACYVLESKISDQSRWVGWICPQKGYTVVREQYLDHLGPASGEVVSQECNCTPAEYNGIWYCSQAEQKYYSPVSQERLTLGIAKTEKVSITSCQFNTGLDDSDLTPREETYRYVRVSAMNMLIDNPFLGKEENKAGDDPVLVSPQDTDNTKPR
mgnify:CR=1 FL=1